MSSFIRFSTIEESFGKEKTKLFSLFYCLFMFIHPTLNTPLLSLTLLLSILGSQSHFELAFRFVYFPFSSEHNYEMEKKLFTLLFSLPRKPAASGKIGNGKINRSGGGSAALLVAESENVEMSKEKKSGSCSKIVLLCCVYSLLRIIKGS